MKNLFRLFVALICISFAADCASACECAKAGPICDAYGEAAAVFVGVVTGESVVTETIENHRYRRRHVTLAVETSFHGIEGATATVITGLGGADCGFIFKTGERYLVYARSEPEPATAGQAEKRLYTSRCTRTRAIVEAGEDLNYIRGLSSAVPGSLIYGEIFRSTAGIKVSIESAQKSVETATDAGGRFSAGRLPPGSYKVRITLPPGLTAEFTEQETRVADRGCAKVYFGVRSDGRLGGRVVDINGDPLPKAEIYLCRTFQKQYPLGPFVVKSDGEGRYEFAPVPPGQYVVGVRFDGLTIRDRPFPQFYHPAVASIEGAAIVKLGDGERIDKYDLRVPAPPADFSVSGKVLWADVRPMPRAKVEYSSVDSADVYVAEPDEQGRFSFKAYDGLTIVIRTAVEIEPGNYIYGDWVRASVRGEDLEVAIPAPVGR